MTPFYRKQVAEHLKRGGYIDVEASSSDDDWLEVADRAIAAVVQVQAEAERDKAPFRVTQAVEDR